MSKRKTPDYVLRANERYRQKFDLVSCKFPKGTKERIKAHTDESINAFINRLVAAELEKLGS